MKIYTIQGVPGILDILRQKAKIELLCYAFTKEHGNII